MSQHRRTSAALIASAMGFAMMIEPAASLAQGGSPSPPASPDAGASIAPPASETPGVAPVVVGEACQAAAIDANLKKSGAFTVSTDNPAYFPWFDGAVPEGSEWGSLGRFPETGEGFESAIAYAVAAALGFTSDQVVWLPQAEFGLAIKPGEKDYDIHLGQVEYGRKRAERVDFSNSYFEANQSIVTVVGNPINEVVNLAGLKPFRLGAATGTTSLDLIENVIQPVPEVRAYKNNAAAVRALKNEQLDGLVVNLPSAFYVRDVQLNDFDTPEAEGAIVGQIATEVQGYFGIVLQKDSPLTACINEALAALKANGTWQQIYDSEISQLNDAPFLP